MMWKLADFKGNTAIITENGEKISYGELDRHCGDLAANISERCLVFNLCANEIGSLVGYVGFLNNNIVPLMLSGELDDELLDNFLNTYKPGYINVPDRLAHKFEEFERVHSNLGYTLLKTPYDMAYPLHDELALLLTTSGSTGSPKLVRLSYNNIRANAESIVEYLRLNAGERPITTLPMNYTYGLSIINSHLLVGATIILTEKTLMQKEFWQQFKEFEATSFGGVPYTYEMLDRLRFCRMQLPSLRTCTQAGGKITPDLHGKFAQWAADSGKNFVVMYGQTEATARMSYLSPEKSAEKCGSIGIAIPGGRFSLINEEGKEITTPETVGELVYEGENVTLGYAEHGEHLALGDERQKKLVTGDMAKFDADGYYYIVGRKKRFLKIFGNRVNLDETERLIKSNFAGMECACAGEDDNMCIFITDDSLREQVLSFVARKTGLNHVAFKIKQIDNIPKNEAGKTLYKDLE